MTTRKLTLAALAAAGVLGCTAPTDVPSVPPPPPTIHWRDYISPGKMDSMTITRVPELDDSVYIDHGDNGWWYQRHGFEAHMKTTVPAQCIVEISGYARLFGFRDSTFIPRDTATNWSPAGNDLIQRLITQFEDANAEQPLEMSTQFRVQGIEGPPHYSFAASCRDNFGQFLTGSVGEVIYWQPLPFGQLTSQSSKERT